MSKRKIPVVLLFSNVAANSNLVINITSKEVRWSLGGTSPNNLGFSYNVLPDNAVRDASAIQSISFDDDELTVVTSASAAPLSSFTLTLALEVDEGTHHLRGFCTLNAEAVVHAYFGAEQPMQWRDGRITAVLHHAPRRFCPVLMSISGARSGTMIEILLSSPADQSPVQWALGPSYGGTIGLTVYGTNGLVSLSQFNYGVQRIQLQTAGSAGGAEASAIGIVAFVMWQETPPDYFYLSLNANPNVSVNAQVGHTLPQYISAAHTLYVL